jgi:hypothetical protein
MWTRPVSCMGLRVGCGTAQGSQTDFKNELLHSQFQINYNDLPAIFRKVCKAQHSICMTQYSRIVAGNPWLMSKWQCSSCLLPDEGASNVNDACARVLW